MTTTEEAARFRDLYLAAFQENTRARCEDSLHVAYELGREAVAGELGLLELTHIHHMALASRLEGCEPQDIAAVMETANEFFLQTLSAYEMVRRGFVETQEELRSEREHAHQLRRLADTSLVINSSLSIEDMLQAATEHSRGTVGADCCVACVTAAHADIAKTAISYKGDPSIWNRLISEPVVAEIHDAASLLDEPVRFTRDDLPLRSLGEARASVGEVLVAPLKRKGKGCVGFIVLANGVGRRFTDKDQSILIQLAQSVSAAVDNAVLYARERRVAETFQRGLLPERLPEVPGIEVSARYLPGAAGLNVGGDWFDLVRLPNDRTGVVIGDVVGRGVRAATVMGQIRTAFRAYSMDGSPPETVIGRLDRLMSSLDPDHFSTVAYLVWDPAEGEARAVVAGHPPPLLVDPSGGARYLDGDTSVPLGTMDGFPYRSLRMAIEAGSTLVMYTDGLVEQGGPLDDRLRDLATIASAEPAPPEQLCDRILGSMLPGDNEDDVAILVVRFSRSDPAG